MFTQVKGKTYLIKNGASPASPIDRRLFFGQVHRVKDAQGLNDADFIDLSDVAKQLKGLGNRLNNQFVARQDLIKASLLACASGEPVFAYSRPGEAKTGVFKSLAESLGGKFFSFMLEEGTHKSDLIGERDPIAYQKGEWVRLPHGIAISDFVFLDEVWKARHANNTILDALAERVIENNQSIPMVTCFSASNEIPTDSDMAASWDRWTLRVKIDPIKDADDFDSLLDAVGSTVIPPQSSITPDHCRLMGAISEDMAINLPKEIKETIKKLWADSGLNGAYQISPRRWKKLAKMTVTNALLDGRTEIKASDVNVARFLLWDDLDEVDTVRDIISSYCDPYASEILTLKAIMGELKSNCHPASLQKIETQKKLEMMGNAKRAAADVNAIYADASPDQQAQLDTLLDQARDIAKAIQTDMFGEEI